MLEFELGGRLELHAGRKVSLISCSPLVLLPPIRISTPLLTAGAVHRQPRACTRKDRKNWAHAASHRRIRSEEHTSELQSLMRISYAVFCLKTKIMIHKAQSNLNAILST